MISIVPAVFNVPDACATAPCFDGAFSQLVSVSHRYRARSDTLHNGIVNRQERGVLGGREASRKGL